MKIEKTYKYEYSLKKVPYLEKKDKRYKKYVKQLKDKGFCDPETWNLDVAMAYFILPRLKRFKELNNGYPGEITPEKWDEVLDKMIFAFDFILNEDDIKLGKDDFDEAIKDWEKAYEKYKEGMLLFGAYFRHLWW